LEPLNVAALNEQVSGGASLSDDDPADLGTADPGVGTEASRSDHVHDMPSAADVGAVDVALVGAADGVAELDSGGLVPSSQLPSYVDDVIEAANFAALPGTGETGKIYVTLDNNLTFRWSGSAYVEISASLALGETSSTAYRGDRGKTAFDHSQVVTGNPHGTTAADVGAQAADADLTTIAGLTPTTDSFMQAKAGAWAARTIAEVKTDLGISSPHLFITPAINDYVGMPSPNVGPQGIANYVLGATGRGNISPIWLPGATYDRIGVYVQSGGTATLRLGLYTADATTGLPGTKVFDAGTISTASTGLIEATISQTLAAGWYWAAVVNDAHTSTFDLMGWSDSIAPTIFGSASQTSAPFRQRVALASSSWTTGGLTTSPPTLSWQAAGVKVVLRRSA